MVDVLSIVVPLFGLILVGMVAGRSPLIASHGRALVDWLLTMLALPALLFHIVANSSSSILNNVPFVFTVTFGTYCAFAISFTIAALRNRGDIREASLKGALGSYGSIAYLGPALVLPAFGPMAGLPLALIFFLDGLLVRLLPPVLWAIGGRDRSLPSTVFRANAQSVLKQPALIAVFFGGAIAVAGWNLPIPLNRTLDLLGSAAAPLGLLGLGLALAGHRSLATGNIQLRWSVALGIKLVVHPTIVYLLVGWIGDFDPAWTYTALFLAALPPAWKLGMIRGDLEESIQVEPTAAAGLVLSIVTITALVALVVTGVLPADPFVSDR
ncbi:MAG: AEC family transporter [Alphaproteobacteria bacterium]